MDVRYVYRHAEHYTYLFTSILYLYLAVPQVYEPRESDSESDSEPPLPSLLGVKGLQEDALSELLSSSEDELLVAPRLSNGQLQEGRSTKSR